MHLECERGLAVEQLASRAGWNGLLASEETAVILQLRTGISPALMRDLILRAGQAHALPPAPNSVASLATTLLAHGLPPAREKYDSSDCQLWALH